MAYSQGFQPHKTKILTKAETALLSDPRKAGFDRRKVGGRRDWAMVQLLRVSGMRAAEVAGLRFEHIHREEVDGQPSTLLFFPGKGQRWREIVLGGDLAETLNAWTSRHPSRCRPMDPVFPALSKHGKPKAEAMTACACHCVVRRLGDRLGIDHLHPHRFRHTIATMLAEKDVPMPAIMQTLGHSSPTTTMRYIATSRKHLGAALLTANA